MSGSVKTFEQGARCLTCTKSLVWNNTKNSRKVHTCQHVVLCDSCFIESRLNGMNFCPVCRTDWPPFNPAFPYYTGELGGLVPDPNRPPGSGNYNSSSSSDEHFYDHESPPTEATRRGGHQGEASSGTTSGRGIRRSGNVVVGETCMIYD